jgi:hypothetical protein
MVLGNLCGALLGSTWQMKQRHCIIAFLGPIINAFPSAPHSLKQAKG